ncbi:hypothetical protein [Sphingomonas sp. 28-62-20]|uniref:hypothetical protein n=1 Tax=Sphingomonas sp. 28-62-20 TaxID=1970433 RepID=UPI0035A8C90A
MSPLLRSIGGMIALLAALVAILQFGTGFQSLPQILAFAGFKPTQSASKGTPSSTRPTLEMQALALAKLYVHNSRLDSETAITWVNNNYTNEVEYYGQISTKFEVIKDKISFLSRWPIRELTIKDSDINAECDISSKSCKVMGNGLYNYASVLRKKTSHGRFNFRLLVHITQD